MSLLKPEWLKYKNIPAYMWNPVMGCNRNCPDCTVQDLNAHYIPDVIDEEKIRRSKIRNTLPPALFNNFYGDIESLKDFAPVLLWNKFLLKFPDTCAHILVNALSDINYWQTIWIEKVFEKIKKFPQHRFFFLTKNINTYLQYTFPDNCRLGVVIDNQHRLYTYENVYRHTHINEYVKKHLFFVIKALDTITVSPLYYKAGWIIINFEKKQPHMQPDEITIIKSTIRHYHETIPFFMESSCKDIWQEELIREFPDFN